MADYVIKRLEEAPDVLGDYPGEMRMMTYELDAEKVAFTWRRMPPQTGGKGSYGHRHKEAEEIYFVLEGHGEMELEGERAHVESGQAIPIPPGAWHQMRNVGAGPLRIFCCCSPPYRHEDTFFD